MLTDVADLQDQKIYEKLIQSFWKTLIYHSTMS